jgi:hypothetical protein
MIQKPYKLLEESFLFFPLSMSLEGWNGRILSGEEKRVG